MRSIFSDKGILLLIIIFVASASLAQYTPEFIQSVRGAQLQLYLKALFDFLNSIPPAIIDFIFNTIHFSAKVFSTAGNLELNPATLISFVALLVIGFGFVVLRYAIKSKAFFDDFLALGGFYIALQVCVGIWIRLGILPQPLRAGTVAGIMTLILIYLMFRAGAAVESKLFFRGLLQIYLIWLFVLPSETIEKTLGSLAAYADFCNRFMPPSTPLSIALSAVGLFIALGQIYGVGSKPSRSTAEVLVDLKKKVGEAFDKANKKD
jgi:hypothetical protein